MSFTRRSITPKRYVWWYKKQVSCELLPKRVTELSKLSRYLVSHTSLYIEKHIENRHCLGDDFLWH